RVHPRGGEHQAVPGLDDPGVAAAGDDPDGLGVDGRAAVRTGADAALRLAHDLAGDHEDVAVREARRVLGRPRGEVVARADLADAGDGQDLDHAEARPATISAARSSAAVAIAAVAGRSRMSRGTARARMPAAATGATASASAVSTSQPSRNPCPA